MNNKSYVLAFLCTIGLVMSFASCQTLSKDKEQIKKIGGDCIDEVFATPPVTMRGTVYDDIHPCNRDVK
jgi:hypothetical protein